MQLERQDVVAGFALELTTFEDLLRGLTDEEWTTPTRCAGWAVKDVAAHVVGTLELIVTGRTAEIAEPDHVDKQVAKRTDRSRTEVVDELHAHLEVLHTLLAALDDDAWRTEVPGGVSPTVGDGVETLWYDTYVHAEDIRAAIGRSPQPGAGLAASVAHLAEMLTDRGWGPATLALAGIREYAVSGGGPRITGDPLDFVLAATGRKDPADLELDEKVNVYA